MTPQNEACFPVRLFQNDEGRWWAEVYHDATLQASWDSGEYDTWEEALEAAKAVLDEAMDTALYHNSKNPHQRTTFTRMQMAGKEKERLNKQGIVVKRAHWSNPI